MQVAALAISAISLILAGCATDYSRLSPQDVASQVKVQRTESDAQSKYIAPFAVGVFGPDIKWVARLTGHANPEQRTWRDGLSVTWEHSSPGWLMVERVVAAGYPTLKAQPEKRRMRACPSENCTRQQNFSVLLPRELLAQFQNTGLNLVFSSRRGDVLMKLPASYVSGYLLATDEPRKQVLVQE